MSEISVWVWVCIILLLLSWIGISLKQVRQLKKQLTQQKELQYGEMVRTIDYHRHDWMNDIQVLLGYIQLKKQDKLLDYINRMIEQMRLEGLISRLGVPALTAYLVSFRANTNALILQVRLEQEISLTKLGEQGNRIAQLIVDFVEVYKLAAGYGEGEANKLSVTMSVWNDQLFIQFEYDGASDIIRIRDNLQGIIEHIHAGQDIQVTMIENENSMDIDVNVRLGVVKPTP